ncbi:hypothetical protein [Leuconostoc gasicomitatum]|uniref:hypothetical protein n=1 Tax=Leuconostoc gasicomitatum TaxID=115778 RepID=UPI001CC3D58C|nr:hypothetical protein [Leuconostoc gasicomitatum]MBZ5946024.1 hypothetical protein [Leuconostoc gasicomitatum]
MTINIGDVQASFVDGKIVLKYFSASFNAGEFPNSINGNIQVTPDDGLTILSSQEEVTAAAKKKIQTLVADVVA